MDLHTVVKKITRKIKYYSIQTRYERTFEGQKYIFIPEKKSTKLIVVFSGFTGEKAKYNYIFTLDHMRINKLFILDNFGYKGCYYLLANGCNDTEIATSHIIEKIRSEHKIDTIITAGSSKGGSAALFFGFKHHADYIISAACQFYIGTYLARDEHRRILDAMMTNPDNPKYNVGETIKYLDGIIEESFDYYTNQYIELYYSDKELTYERQIIPLIHCLQKKNIPFHEHIEHFDKHEDVGVFFSSYLRRRVAEIINEKNS